MIYPGTPEYERYHRQIDIVKPKAIREWLSRGVDKWVTLVIDEPRITVSGIVEAYRDDSVLLLDFEGDCGAFRKAYKQGDRFVPVDNIFMLKVALGSVR